MFLPIIAWSEQTISVTMYINICIYIFVHIYITATNHNIYIYAYIHIHIYIYIYIYLHIHIYIYICIARAFCINRFRYTFFKIVCLFIFGLGFVLLIWRSVCLIRIHARFRKRQITCWPSLLSQNALVQTHLCCPIGIITRFENWYIICWIPTDGFIQIHSFRVVNFTNTDKTHHLNHGTWRHANRNRVQDKSIRLPNKLCFMLMLNPSHHPTVSLINFRWLFWVTIKSRVLFYFVLRLVWWQMNVFRVSKRMFAFANTCVLNPYDPFVLSYLLTDNI